MATNIYKYDGELLTTVADGAIATTESSIKFPGRGYVNYGQPVNENMLWILQNFASPTSPENPLDGQTWYDTNSKLLKIYDDVTLTWVSVGGVIQSSTPPAGGSNKGAFWYDTAKNQLHVWSGSAWLLVGPLGASDGLDPLSPAVPGYSQFDSARLSDGTTTHSVWRLIIGGQVLAIFSKDAAFTPSPAIAGFTTIRPGLNLNSSISGVTVSGDTTLFRNNQDNIPSGNDVYNLGSATFRFANVYATLFDGTATQARYADLAERYESDREYPPGTVVVLGGDKEVTVTGRPGDDNVFGVISTDPAVLMNSSAGDNLTHPPVALTGRVPCKIVGQVKKGQRLMASSMEGVACAWDPAFGQLAILGRSLSDKTSHGVDLVEIVIGKN